MQKKIVWWLVVCGALFVFSAISGISSVSTSQDKVDVAHYNGILFRILNAIFGGALLSAAWFVRKRHVWGWKMFFLIQIFAWVLFVIGGTKAVESNYKVHSARDDLLMGGILAIVSFPVVFYWCWRWHKERKNFDSNEQ